MRWKFSEAVLDFVLSSPSSKKPKSSISVPPVSSLFLSIPCRKTALDFSQAKLWASWASDLSGAS